MISHMRELEPASAASTRSLVLTATEARTDAPLNIVGETTLVKVGTADSDGLLSFFHLEAPPMSGPPRHVHSREDELFYVLDGELVFELDGTQHTVTAGGTVYLKRGVVHAYQNFTDHTARLLIATTPGEFSTFFEELSAMTPEAGMPPMEPLLALHERYGIAIVGPPMAR